MSGFRTRPGAVRGEGLTAFRGTPLVRAWALLIAAWLGLQPLAAAAQEWSATGAALEEAREQIKTGDYDRAIEILRSAIERDREHPERLADAYLLLIKTYVFLGNDFKFRPQGREMSNLNYRAARDLIVEVLEIPALRHLKPEPVSEYPPEMVGFFSEVRSQKFGSFRVARLEPPGAVVTFDGDTLGAYPGDTMPGDVDLPVGKHLVQVRAPGHEDASDEITISPNSTLERSYQLRKRRGPWWYASRIGTGLAAAAGVVALIVGKGDGGTSSGPEPLPGAPPPPSR